MTPAQCRAARALLDWNQRDLARFASVGFSTVADFERGARVPITNNFLAMKSALRRAGIRFPAGGAILKPR